MSRLAGGGVPFWQPALAVLLLILTAYFIVQAVARISGSEFYFRVRLLTPSVIFWPCSEVVSSSADKPDWPA